ncbi:MAG TPA: redoxin domain-containing protein [Puia sp.]|jgi:peroxiredoxin
MKRNGIIVASLFLSACSWFDPKFTSGKEGQPLPDFELHKDSLTVLNTASIIKGKAFILYLYDPSCPFCRKETEDIVKNMNDLRGISLYMVTSLPYSAMNKYSELYHLSSYPNLTLARDSANDLLDYFKSPGVPYLAFYDEQKRLKQVLIGQIGFDKIKDILRE